MSRTTALAIKWKLNWVLGAVCTWLVFAIFIEVRYPYSTLFEALVLPLIFVVLPPSVVVLPVLGMRWLYNRFRVFNEGMWI